MRVALVHDYLTQIGGAERVLDALHGLWPSAPVLTAIVNPDIVPGHWNHWDIRTHPLARPALLKRDHRLLFPLYPAIFRSLGRQLDDVDVVVSDSSAWAHRIVVPADIPHVCYCHSPARFLWKDASYLDHTRLPVGAELLSRAMATWMRQGDWKSARRVDHYIANSRTVAARINSAYGIDATVIYPPVDVDRFRRGPDPQVEDWFLVVSRLVPHKRIDLAIDACRLLGKRLKVIGTGRQAETLRTLGSESVEFLGAMSDHEVADHMRRCRALIVPAVEDFGIAAVEAQAAGRPVVTLRAGGALETVIEGETGLFFGQATAESLAATLAGCESRDWNVERCRDNAARFSTDRFQAEMREAVDVVVRRRRERNDVTT